jgi:hypothetical protein
MQTELELENKLNLDLVVAGIRNGFLPNKDDDKQRELMKKYCDENKLNYFLVRNCVFIYNSKNIDQQVLDYLNDSKKDMDNWQMMLGKFLGYVSPTNDANKKDAVKFYASWYLGYVQIYSERIDISDLEKVKLKYSQMSKWKSEQYPLSVAVVKCQFDLTELYPICVKQEVILRLKN